MVNYCCVNGCGRNSRTNKHLNYYSLPKEKYRQKQWLKAAGKDDLLNKDMEKLRRTLRFCSRHFLPTSIKNRHLNNDAVPTKSLPGSLSEGDDDVDPIQHEGVICDNCSEPIFGFRYKCVTCENYDLCQKCEMLEAHSEHYMLRIPKSLKFKLADNLINKWKSFFKSEHVTPESDTSTHFIKVESGLSSDDEPVTKYARNYDSGLDLSEDVKKSIRNEVDRALKSLKEKEKKKTKLKRKESNKVTDVPSKKLRSENNSMEVDMKKQKAPELVFADVNEHDENCVKSEDTVCSSNNNQQTEPQTERQTEQQAELLEASVPVLPNPPPVYCVKISEDLSQLMIEVTPLGTGASEYN